MIRLRPTLAVLIGLAALAGATPPRPTGAQTAAIQTQETNFPGVNAELVECRRKDGVLTIRLRLRNTGKQAQQVTLVTGREYKDYYVTAGTKKYFVLRDTEKTPLAVAADSGGSVAPSIPPGGAYTWWAKYPAPPADVKKVNYITPLGAPFEDVPVTD
jgi:hypothetical protein